MPRRCRPRPFATARGKLELAHARGVGSSRAGRGSGGVHPAAGKARAWASLCKLGAGSWSQPMAAGGRHVLGRGVPGLGPADHGGGRWSGYPAFPVVDLSALSEGPNRGPKNQKLPQTWGSTNINPEKSKTKQPITLLLLLC